MLGLIQLLGSILALGALGYLAGIALPAELSLYVALGTFVIMGILAVVPGAVARLTFFCLGVWIVSRYMIWRFASLPLDSDWVSAVLASMLLLAECYGVLMLVLGMFVNALPLERKPIPLPEDESVYPEVDVYIPTYSEGLDVVQPTLLGALNIDYPRDKFRVYVLDDGYPRSKTSKGEQALLLAKRAEDLQALCARHGATYLTRDNNFHAKSGNMNSAMKQTSGELILVLDADHIPTRDILRNTVGFFLKDKNLAFVQTPHFFINPDPVEKNLSLFNKMPAENDMFYAIVQKGLDLWNTSFFCGSAALLSRKAILDVGGFSTESITEDASTSVKMHAKGWNSAYLGIPMVGGLQPESFDGFIVQRMRWAMGMVQIFMKQNPLLVRGLSFGQRLCYLSVISFWLFPFSRTMFYIAPVLAIVFNLKLFPVGGEFFWSYTVPYLFVVVLAFEKLFGRVRRILTSELYETLQGFYALPGIISAVINPNKPSFKVTPKGERHDEEHISQMSGPFYMFYFLSLLGAGYGFFRFFTEPENRAALGLSLFWLGFNFMLLNGAMGVLVEKIQLRLRPRVDLDELVKIHTEDGRVVSGVVVDANELGALVLLPTEDKLLTKFEIETPEGILIPAETLVHRWTLHNKEKYPVLLKPRTSEEERALIGLVYGSSDRWMKMWKGRENNTNPVVLVLGFAYLGVKTVFRHFGTRFKNLV